MATYHNNNMEAKEVDEKVIESPPVSEGVEAGEAKQLHRKLKSRHMQMIAIGGSIGAGLFIGSGSALYRGGPASLVLNFVIIGTMLLFTVNALGELAVMYPVNGAFFDYSVRFIDPAWGFAMGWNYAFSWLVVLPFELTAASLTIGYWDPDQKVNIAVWITIFLLSVVVVNFFGVRGYGEVEFALSMMKIVAIIGFILFAIILNCGGVKSDPRGYIGGMYWRDPYEPFKNGFHGFCSVFVTAAFAFGGTELVGLAAAETDNPARTLPKATKQVFWRITLFYVISLLMVGLVVPGNDPVLAKASGANSSASPFVLAIKNAGISGLPSVFNAVIMLSVISVANSCSYGSTRTLQAMAMKGMAPKWGAYIDNKGRPLVVLIVALIFGCLAYVNLAPTGDQIFGWLLALTGLANLFTWVSINFAHIRFRKAWKIQGRSMDEIPFKAQFGVIGSWIGLTIGILSLIAVFYISLYPVGPSENYLNVENFFGNYLAAPVVVFFFVLWKVWKREWWVGVDLATIDLDYGRRSYRAPTRESVELERAERKWYKRFL